MSSTPTRFPAGVTNVPKAALLGNFILPSPVAAHVYVNDFDNAPVAADWSLLGGIGVLTAGNGGLITQTSAGGGTDPAVMQKTPAAFQVAQGLQTWFMWNGQVAALTQLLRVGLQFGGTPTTPTDGIYFLKQAAASPNVDFVMRVGGTNTILPAVTTLTAASRITLGWYFDGRATPTIYVYSSAASPALVAQGQPFWTGGQMVAAAGAQAPGGLNLATVLPIGINMAPAFGFVETVAGAQTMVTDYIFAANEILRN